MEIFQQTSDYIELRLGGASTRTRGLDRAAVDGLVEAVERTYADGSVAPRVFGSTQLRQLGEQLYAFLDGDERWLGDVLSSPLGVRLRISAEERAVMRAAAMANTTMVTMVIPSSDQRMTA